MQALNYLHPDSVLVRSSATSRDELYRSLLQTLMRPEVLADGSPLTVDIALAALLERERSGAVNVAPDVAFPHARLKGLIAPALAMAVLKEPLLYPEGESARLVIVMLVPAEHPSLAIKILACLARFCQDGSALSKLLQATTVAGVWDVLREHPLSIDAPLCARDIMSAPDFSVREDTPLTEITRLMHSRRLFVVPVLDQEGRVVGDITCNRLFRFGLPDFFTKLQSVSFIAEFDPFEQYFEVESKSMARDLVVPDVGIIPPEHTMLEIVFDLAVRKYPRLYVVDENRHWIGTIDRSTVLDNVINF